MTVALRMFLVASAAALLSLVSALSSRPAPAQPGPPPVEIYPAPAGAPVSPHFTVMVRVGGVFVEAPAYETANPFPPAASSASPQPPFEWTTAWTSFATDTEVTVQVAPATPFASARILPTSAGIEPTLSGRNGSHYTSLSFKIGGKGLDGQGTGIRQVSVEFCYTDSPCTAATQRLRDLRHPLLVFVSPLSANVPPSATGAVLTPTPGQPVPPLGSGQTMVSFGPGFHDLGPTPYALPANATAYLAGGAWVRGTFAIGDGTTIAGLGVLSGDGCTPPPDEPNPCYMMIAGPAAAGAIPKPVSGVTLSGVTLVDAPFYNVLLGGTGNHVSNIKVMAWRPNTDGISTGSGSLTGSFFKVGDDAIKLYSSGLSVSACTLWQLGNAAPFELGVNLSEAVKGISVQDSDVIRTEWTYPNRSNAVFSAAFGGKGTGSQYTFGNIRVENANPSGLGADGIKPVFQLFKLAVIPNPWATAPNVGPGAIDTVGFTDIHAAERTTLPDLFQSFDWKHRVSGVTFDRVTVDGATLPTPAATWNANRNYSLSGTPFSNILWRGVPPTVPATSFQAAVFDGAAGGWPATPLASLAGPDASQPGFAEAWAIGDVDGQGMASVLFLDSATTPGAVTYGLWDQPFGPSPQAVELLKYDAGSRPVGLGDFNGDGRADLVLWDPGRQVATLVLMGGARVAGMYFATPPAPTGGRWSLAGIGDVDQNGYSDLLLRDDAGHMMIGSYDGGPQPTWQKPIPVAAFDYGGGTFDPSSWEVAAVGDVRGLGYASVVWVNRSACKLGITGFSFTSLSSVGANALLDGTMPPGCTVAATGDYNGDGTMDLLLSDATTGQLTIWYTGYKDGALSWTGPTLTPPQDYALQP